MPLPTPATYTYMYYPLPACLHLFANTRIRCNDRPWLACSACRLPSLRRTPGRGTAKLAQQYPPGRRADIDARKEGTATPPPEGDEAGDTGCEFAVITEDLLDASTVSAQVCCANLHIFVPVMSWGGVIPYPAREAASVSVGRDRRGRGLCACAGGSTCACRCSVPLCARACCARVYTRVCARVYLGEHGYTRN